MFGLIGGWAQDTPNVVFDWTSGGEDTEINDVKVSFNDGKFDSKGFLQINNSGSITLSSTFKIKKVIYIFQDESHNGSDATLNVDNVPSSDYELVGTEGTLTGITANEVTFKKGNSNVRITKIEVYYLKGPVFKMNKPSTTTNILITTNQIELEADKDISDANNTEGIKATFGKQGETGDDISGALDTKNKTIITFTIPSTISLAKNTTYKLTLPAGEVKDADNTENSEQTFTFKTVEGLTFTMTVPEDKSTDIPVTTNKIVLTANKESISANTDVDIKDKIKVSYTTKNSDGTDNKTLQVNGETSIENNTLVFTPTRNLRASMTYTVSLDADVVTGGSETNSRFEGTFTTASNEHMITGVPEKVDGGYTVDMGNISMIYGGDKDRVTNAVWNLLDKAGGNDAGESLVPQSYTIDKVRKCKDLDPMNEYCIYNADTKEVSYGSWVTNNWGWPTRDEGEFDHTNHLLIDAKKVHQKTFHQPCYGNLMFRPKADGTLIVYLLQQGAMQHDKDKSSGYDNTVIRKRPVYIIDEAGELVKDIVATTTSKIPAGYNNITKSTLTGDYDENNSNKGIYTKDQHEMLKDMYDQWIKDNADNNTGNVTIGTDGITIGSEGAFQGVICLHHQSTGNDKTEEFTDKEGKTWKYTPAFKELLYKVNGCDRNGNKTISDEENNKFNDETGFMLIDEGFVKYEIPVLAGKTYNIFGYRTKIGYVGFDFIEDQDYDNKVQSISLYEEQDNTETIKNADRNTPYDVTIDRKFFGSKWQTLVLPFSVSVSQVKEVFGEGTEIIHFEKKEGNTIYLRRHILQRIVGGTPVLIKPAQDVEKNVVFTNVHFTGTNGSADIDAMSNEDNGTEYRFNATYKAGSKYLTGSDFTVPAWSYFVDEDGTIYQTNTAMSNMRAFRAWIEGETSNKDINNCAKYMDFGDIPDNETTGIMEALADPTLKSVTGNVYNINGQIVRRNASTVEGLPKGMYIMNGKKLIVK